MATIFHPFSDTNQWLLAIPMLAIGLGWARSFMMKYLHWSERLADAITFECGALLFGLAAWIVVMPQYHLWVILFALALIVFVAIVVLQPSTSWWRQALRVAILAIFSTYEGIALWGIRFFPPSAALASAGVSILIPLLGYVMLTRTAGNSKSAQTHHPEPQATPTVSPVPPPSISEAEQKRIELLTQEAKAYEKLIHDDENAMSNRIRVLKADVGDQLDLINGSYLDFKFRVFNGTVFEIEVGKAVRGEGLQFKNKPITELLNPQSHPLIYHGQDDQVIIRQTITPALAQMIMDGARTPTGIELEFGFQNVLISVDYSTPLGEVKRPTTLSIPSVQKYRVTRSGDFYKWEALEIRGL